MPRSWSRSGTFWVLLLSLLIVAAVATDLIHSFLRSSPKDLKDPDERAAARGWLPAVDVAQVAPDFEFRERDGTSLRLSDLHGKGVLVAFYDSGARSRVFTREFQKIRDYVGASRIREIAVFEGTPAEVSEFARASGTRATFVTESAVAHPVADLYRVKERPCAWVVDRNGHVYYPMPPVDVDGKPDGHLSAVARAFTTIVPRPRLPSEPLPKTTPGVLGGPSR